MIQRPRRGSVPSTNCSHPYPCDRGWTRDMSQKQRGQATIHDAAPWIFITTTTDHRLRTEKNGVGRLTENSVTRTRARAHPSFLLSFVDDRKFGTRGVRGSSTWNAKEKRDRDRRRGRASGGMAETRRRSIGRREIVNYVRGWMVDRWPIVRIYGVETSEI